MTEFLVALIVMVVGAFATFAVLGRAYSRWYGIVLIGFILRVLLAVADRFFIDLPQSSSDAEVFYQMAITYSRAGCGNFVNFDVSASYVYSALVGQVFACVGTSQIGIQLINCFAGLIGAISLARLSALIWNQKVADKVILFLLLFPTLILYSAVTLRESLIFMFFSVGLLNYFLATQTRSTVRFVGAILLLVAAGALHSGMLFAIVGLVAAFVFSSRAKGRGKFIDLLTRASISLLVLAGLYVYAGSIELNKFGELGNIDTEAVASIVASRAQGGAAYLTNLTISSPVDIVWQMPIRMFYFIFSPMPWDIRSLSHLFGLVDVVFWIYLAIIIVRNRKMILANKRALTLLMVFATLTVAFSFGTSNFGTAMRHRAKFVPVLFVIAGPALLARRERRAGALPPLHERRAPPSAGGVRR